MLNAVKKTTVRCFCTVRALGNLSVGTPVGLLLVVSKDKSFNDKDSQCGTRRKRRQVSKETHGKEKYIIFKASEKQKPRKGKERGKKIIT